MYVSNILPPKHQKNVLYDIAANLLYPGHNYDLFNCKLVFRDIK